MTDRPPTVDIVATIPVPDPMPPAITRPRQHVEAVLTQSLAETGEEGRAALAWQWALTGTRPSPVTLSLGLGRPPSREDIRTEADGDPESSPALPGVPTDYCDQLGEARRILRWLVGSSDEIPADCDNRGELIGARGDYVRSDDEIRHVRDSAERSLEAIGLPNPMAPDEARKAWRLNAVSMDAAWLRGVRDLLDWVLGDCASAPLSKLAIAQPTAYDLSYEDSAAGDIIMRGGPNGHRAGLARYQPPQYAEAVQASIRWLRGESTLVPSSPYNDSSGRDAAVRGPTVS